ncbi:MAG: GntR family transcriptional regulator [Anaerolineae bacterium]
MAENLRTAIIRLEVKPGERIRQEEVALMMNVSPGPVREALTYLEQEGLVVREHNRGFRVRVLSREDLEEIHSLRLMLELMAVDRAIRSADEAEFAVMKQVVERMADLVARGCTVDDAVDVDMQFHDLLCRAAHQPRLLKFWQALRSQICMLLRGARTYDFYGDAALTHGRILQALSDRNGELAKRLVTEHAEEGYARLR